MIRAAAGRWRGIVGGLAGAALCAMVAANAADPRRSGRDDMSAALQALQADDTQNPAFLWVGEGQALWSQPVGSAGKACSNCHGDAATSMRGVAPSYPAYDAVTSRPMDLAGRINACRQRHQGAPALAAESPALLGLEAYVAQQSRGMPITPATDARLAPWLAQGRTLYNQRLGQLNLSCSQCHDSLAGGKLGGATIPQGHATGYPLYRLEWQGMGSLQRRLRGCLTGVRAEPFAANDPAWLALALYLAQRAAGMPLETPAVRP